MLHQPKFSVSPHTFLWQSKKFRLGATSPRPVMVFCSVCGSLVETHKPYCHTCEFWMGIVAQQATNTRCFVAGGMAYYIGNENTLYKGSAGNLWFVEFKDGRRVATTNLWTNGRIPHRWLGHLPNSANLYSTTTAKRAGINQEEYVPLPDVQEVDHERRSC